VPSLILGTAQWGSAYGVTNQLGRIDDGVLVELVSVARERGITALDTAPTYGDAEERIARWAGDFTVATKVSGASAVTVTDQLNGSLARLGRASVERCLVHDWPTLGSGQRTDVVRALGEARERGLVGAVGVSAYVVEDLAACLEYADAMSIAQVPANVLDQRLDGSPILGELRRLGWTVQARSVFLQGLLAAPSEAGLGEHPAVRAVAIEAGHHGLSMIDLASAYVRSRDWIDEMVVGVTSAAELVDVASALSAHHQVDEWVWRSLASHDIDLIDPRRWSR